MAVVPFAEYRPDSSDINAEHTQVLSNVIPRSDGYGPFPGLEAFSGALGDTCRGFFCAYRTDGSVLIFAATASKIYTLNSTYQGWTDVSKNGGLYTDCPTDGHWSFAQFNNFVIAVQRNCSPQVFNITSSTEFADLAGSPPMAGGVAIVNRFVVLFDLADYPYRIQWSGLNATTTWTSGTNYSDFQDMSDGGRVRGVAGGEFGLILQEQVTRRMIYQPGSSVVFTIEKIENSRGILAQYSLCQASNRIFYLSPAGFAEATGDGAISPIGAERVDRTILGDGNTAGDLDTNELQMCLAAPDPARNIVLFVYKSRTGNDGQFDKGLVYNYLLKRWAPVEFSGEFIGPTARPGTTLESLDYITDYEAITNAADNGSGGIRITVADATAWVTGDVLAIQDVTGTTEANGNWTITYVDDQNIDLDGSTFTNAYTGGGIVGGSMDELTVSFDDYTSAALPQLAGFSTAHKLGFFSGDALEAVLTTGEVIGSRRRVYVNGAQPITDAEEAYCSVVTRDRLSFSLTYGVESEMDDDGYCPMLDEARSGRLRLRIPAGTQWQFAKGIDVDVKPGSRF